MKDSGIFLAEHLTPTRARLYNLARMYRKATLVDNAWSSDGKIFVLDTKQKKHRVFNEEYLLRFGELPERFKWKPKL